MLRSLIIAITCLLSSTALAQNVVSIPLSSGGGGGDATSLGGITPSAYTLGLIDNADAATYRTDLGLGSIATQAASSVALTGGTINGVTIGGTTPAAGTFTTINGTTPSTFGKTLWDDTDATTARNTLGATTGVWSDAQVTDALTVSGGTVNNSIIGGVTPVAGTFTTLKARTSLSLYDLAPDVYQPLTVANDTWTFGSADGGTPIVVANSFSTADNGNILFGTHSVLTSSADGYLQLLNQARSGFGGLRFGGTSASFPMLKRNATAINFRLADDSADSPITTAAITASGAISGSSLTVSTPLSVANGGTGVATLTGIVKASGTSAFAAATAGTDYYAPGSTDVAIADGGTGASTATAARQALDAGVITINSGRGNFTSVAASTSYYPAFIMSTAVNQGTRLYVDRAGTLEKIRFTIYNQSNPAPPDNMTVQYAINGGSYSNVSTTVVLIADGVTTVTSSPAVAVAVGDYVSFKFITGTFTSGTASVAWQGSITVSY